MYGLRDRFESFLRKYNFYALWIAQIAVILIEITVQVFLELYIFFGVSFFFCLIGFGLYFIVLLASCCVY